MTPRFMEGTPPPVPSRQQGFSVEAAACHYLQQQGLQLLDQNYTLRQAELDLVMHADDTVVFVEVRYRRTDRFGTPAETVTASKQRRLRLAATHWLQAHPAWRQHPCRIDIIAARPGDNGLQFEWIINALGP